MESTPPPAPPAPPAPPTPPAPQSSPSAPRTSSAGFDPAAAFGPLLDFRFTKFITVNIVQVLYIVGIAVIALYTLAVVIAMFRASVGAGIAALIFAPVVFVISVLLLRVYLEIIVVLFRIAESTSETAKSLANSPR